MAMYSPWTPLEVVSIGELCICVWQSDGAVTIFKDGEITYTEEEE